MFRKDSGVEAKVVIIFCILCSIVFLVLFGFSFLFSWVNVEFWNEFVYQRTDSVAGNILGILLAMLLIFLFMELSRKFGDKWNMDRLAVYISVVCMLISIWWVSVSKTVPQGDQSDVISYVEAFDRGDVSGLARGKYVGIYRQQLGLITLIRVLYRIFGKNDYRIFQYFSALMVPILVFSGYQVVKKLTKNSRNSEVVYLVFVLMCVPMYGYVPFVYGEICSTAAVVLGAWMLLSCVEEFKRWKLIVLGIAAGFAVQTRINVLVPLIGFLIVILIKLICRPVWRTASIGVAIIAGVLLSQAAIYAIYGRYIPKDSKPMPAILHIVMGTHDQIEGAPGWYDAYNVELYEEMNWDAAAANAAAYEDLKEFMEKCIQQPAYASAFYAEKMNTQWNVPMYQCLVSNNSFAEDWTPLVESVYEGKIGATLEKYMNIYQLLLYGGVLFLLFAKLKEWDKIEKYVLLIGVYGGFLFSLLWETKARYVFPYMLMMLPYAVIGVDCFLTKMSRTLKKVLQRTVSQRV